MKKILLYFFGGLVLIYGLLLIPNSQEITIATEGNSEPFVWNQDDRWNQLEDQFNLIRENPDLIEENEIASRIANMNIILDDIEDEKFNSFDERLDVLLNQFFETAPYIAAQDVQDSTFFDVYDRTRRVMKRASIDWNVDDLETRTSLYKVLFGMRATVEELLLQSKEEIETVIFVTDESSATPSTELFGIKVHSGDLLVSRGGAEVSALISRGNDFPGNFSHVALIYVEEGTNTAYLIEAHIERGVAIASAEEYMNDGKQRFMVLRPRTDLPELIDDPMLPHLAAKDVFDEVNTRHIPYDFKMDFYDSEKMFCSEVGSYAYKNYGIQLWESESTISSNGVVTLLNTFGVENFVTQMPSDLEYDPKLSVVAEWRDTEALYEDHLYNAVIDAMLECAELKVEIDVNNFMLPAVRLVKGYSVIQNIFESEGPVPEGMNATQALKSDAFIQRHEYLKMITDEDIQVFKADENYLPPYWEMFRMARENAECVNLN
jgi:hypothetical protein